MKRFLRVIAIFAYLGATNALAGVIGPAQPENSSGLSLGFGYQQISSEWEIDGSDVETRQQMPYIQLGLGASKHFSIYLQGGIADLEVIKLFDEKTDAEDDFKPFGTVGIKGLFTDRKPIGIGYFVQGSYFSDYEDEGVLATFDTDLEFRKNWEAIGGLVLQAEIEGALLYGGPMYFLREGEVTVKSTVPLLGTVEETFDYEETDNFGAFVGIRWPITKTILFDGEVQFRSDTAAGGALHFVF